MKKVKNMMLLLFAVLSVFLITDVDAAAFNDNENQIQIPMIISSTGSKLTITNTTNYTLYAQWIEISDEKYVQLKNANATCDSIYEEYKTLVPPSQEDYDTDEEYEADVAIFKDKRDYIVARYEQCANIFYNFYPDFDDTKWSQVIDDTVYLPETAKTKNYVLYIKLDDKQNNKVVYDMTYLKRLDNKDNDSINNTNWINFKKGIKDNEQIKKLNSEDYSITFNESGLSNSDIKSSETFTIMVTEKATSKVYNIKLNYNAISSSYGIVSYETPDNEPEGFELVHSVIMVIVLEEINDVFGYEYDSFMKWLSENQQKLTLVGNGIMYETKKFDYSSKGEGYDTSVSGNYISKLNVNINAPITGYTDPNNDENVKDESGEENAPTGDLNFVTIGGLTLICLGFGIVAYRKTKLN